MKILQIIYSLVPGGAERFVIDLCNELAIRGNDVILCILRDDSIDNQGFYKMDILSQVSYINLKLPVGFRLFNFKALYQVIRNVNPDVVHCHLNLVNYIFPLTLFNNRIKYFYTVHSDASVEVKSQFELNIRNFFFKRNLVKVISISPETSRSISSFYEGIKYAEILNGRQKPEKSDKFEKVTKSINSLRKENDFIFLHIGRCNLIKNQKMLIQTIKSLNDEGEKISLLIIGPDFDSELGKELKATANEHVHFLGEKHNIADYLMNVDAFCLSSIHEGMPITLIESLACGCIPICTPVGGIKDTVVNGITGFLSQSISSEDYFQAVKEFLKNPNLIKKEKLVEQYYDRFSMQQCAFEHMELYRSKKKLYG